MDIQSQNIKFHYQGGESLVFPDLNLSSGSQALLLGSSGSGKTTLLHLLSGLLRPQEGSLLMNENEIYQFSQRELDQFRGKNIGIIFQVPHFLKSLNVFENIALAQKLAGEKIDKERITELLRIVGLSAKSQRKMAQLSQGEKQRVSIVRSLVNQPQLLLADEPTSALDDKNCTAVLDLLTSQAKSIGATLLVVTHDNRLESSFENKIRLGS